MAEYLSAFINFFKPDERFIMHRLKSSRFTDRYDLGDGCVVQIRISR